MPEQICLIGVDVGTTNIKAGAFDGQGHALAMSSVELRIDRPRPGWATFDSVDIWQQTVRVLREVSRAVRGRFEPLAVAVSSMAETSIALDRQGEAVYPAIAWFDARTTEQAEWWKATVGPEFIFARTGLPVLPLFSLNKLCWIKWHEPAIFSRICRWLSVSDYVNFRLCGVEAAELSLASRVMALDLRTRKWSREILDVAGVAPSILGEPLPSGENLGRISAEVARLTELPENLCVVTGGHDHPCAALGSGVFEPGVVLDSMGTSESILVVLDSPVLEPKAAELGFAQGCHVLKDRFLCFGGLVTSGAVIDWARNIFAPDRVREEAYQYLEALAVKSVPGSGGLHFIPSLRAANPPHTDAISRGAFVGLSIESSREDIARGILEGLAYASFETLNALQSVFGIEIKQIRVVGGPARNRLLMEVKAALAGVPFCIVKIEEASCRGASILAGCGIGLYKSSEEIRSSVKYEEQPVEPPPGWANAYAERFENVYRHIYPAVRGLNQCIVALERSGD